MANPHVESEVPLGHQTSGVWLDGSDAPRRGPGVLAEQMGRTPGKYRCFLLQAGQPWASCPTDPHLHFLSGNMVI